MTITGVDMNRDGIPDVLQGGMGGMTMGMPMGMPTAMPMSMPMAMPTAMPMGMPTTMGMPAMTITGVDMNRDGIPDVLQGGMGMGAPAMMPTMY